MCGGHAVSWMLRNRYAETFKRNGDKKFVVAVPDRAGCLVERSCTICANNTVFDTHLDVYKRWQVEEQFLQPQRLQKQQRIDKHLWIID